MSAALISNIGVILLFIGSSVFFTARTWKIALPSSVLVSLGVGFSILSVASFPFSIIFTFSGCCAAVLFLLTLVRESGLASEQDTLFVTLIFRSVFLVILFVVTVASMPALSSVFHNPPKLLLFGSSWLMGIGFLQIGLSENPLRVGTALIFILQGFTLSFLWTEQSVLLIGLLSLIIPVIGFSYSFLASTAIQSKKGVPAP